MPHRSCCPSLSVARVELTHPAAVCGEDSQSRFKRYWNRTSTAGAQVYTQVDSQDADPSTRNLGEIRSYFLLCALSSLLSSLSIFRYKSSQKEVNWSKLKKPVYLSKRGSKFSDWSATWAGYLISKVS